MSVLSELFRSRCRWEFIGGDLSLVCRWLVCTGTAILPSFIFVMNLLPVRQNITKHFLTIKGWKKCNWHFEEGETTWYLACYSESILFQGCLYHADFFVRFFWCTMQNLSVMCVFLPLRALLLGLACNHSLKGVSLDLSSCEVSVPLCSEIDNSLRIVLPFSWENTVILWFHCV